MKIYLGSDHRGFALKNKLIEYLSLQHEAIDCGNTVFDPKDDYPDFAKAVADKVIHDPSSLGIVICGSGIGVCMATNRIKGARCGLGFDQNQVKHAREKDHINMLALSSDYLDFEENKAIVDAFLSSKELDDERYFRRINKIDN